MQPQLPDSGRMQMEFGRLEAQSADLRAQLSASTVEARQLQATLRQLQTDTAQKDTDDLEAKVVGPLDQWTGDRSVQPSVQASETGSLEFRLVNAGTKHSLQHSNKEDYRHGPDQNLRTKSLNSGSALRDSGRDDDWTGTQQQLRTKSFDSGLPTMATPQMSEIVSAELIAPHDDCNVEAYWPDLGVWLPAKLVAWNADGTCTVVWEEDGSSSILPADFVQQGSPQDDEPAMQQDHDDVVLLKLSGEPASQKNSSQYSNNGAVSEEMSRLSTDNSTGCNFVFCTCVCICSCAAMIAIIVVVAEAWSSEGSL